MANSSFQYTAQFLTSIERTISRERLHRYLVAADGDRVKALELYEFNVAISEALYGYLHGLEIAIKNAIHHELNRAYGTPHWYDCAPLSPHHQSKFLQEAKKKAGQNVPAGKVIAELKPRHGFLYIYAECSRLCPESSPKALLESRTEG
jgi:hypothetical protein